MDKRITRFSNLREMKLAEYRAWQNLPGSERVLAAMEISFELYSLKDQRLEDAPGLRRTFVRLKRPSS
jgi:hypothetical protein